MEQRLERLLKQLSETINDSISDSEPVAEVIARIKAAGYDVYVILEATVGFNRRDEESVGTAARPGAPELRISPQDARFLKSLRISVEPRNGPGKAA